MTRLMPPSLTCQGCRAKLPAYLHRELNPRLRRRVAAHLNNCPSCYAAYRQQQEMARELDAMLPGFARPDRAQLGRVWAAVQADMHQPRRSFRPVFRARYSLGVVALLVTLALPWMLGNQSRALALPMPPTPADANLQETPPVANATAAATAEAPDASAHTPPLQPTPDATATRHPNY
jgi:predicted anti-sigma-YlaC factor YlaD